jgi:hypothetical protein
VHRVYSPLEIALLLLSGITFFVRWILGSESKLVCFLYSLIELCVACLVCELCMHACLLCVVNFSGDRIERRVCGGGGSL